MFTDYKPKNIFVLYIFVLLGTFMNTLVKSNLCNQLMQGLQDLWASYPLLYKCIKHEMYNMDLWVIHIHQKLSSFVILGTL